MPHDDLVRVRWVLIRILAVELGLLVVTGVALFFLYRPTAAEGWSELFARSYSWDVRVSNGLRSVHEVTSTLAIPTAVVTGVLLALGGRRSSRRWRSAALGAGAAVTTLAASCTGYLLPWGPARHPGRHRRHEPAGVGPLFDPDVRFVLIAGVELSLGTVLRWLFVTPSS